MSHFAVLCFRVYVCEMAEIVEDANVNATAIVNIFVRFIEENDYVFYWMNNIHDGAHTKVLHADERSLHSIPMYCIP